MHPNEALCHLQFRQWGRVLKTCSGTAFLKAALPAHPFSWVFHFFAFFHLLICTLYNI